MKKNSIQIITILISIATTIPPLNAKPHQVYARSFMSTRPAYEHLSMREGLWHSDVYDKIGPMQGALRAIGFYQQSIGLSKTAHYFLPPCVDTVLVAGDNAPPDIIHDRTVRAEWLGLGSDFRGTFTLNPTEKQYGFALEYNQHLTALIDAEFLENYWISISLPIVAMRRSLHLTEQNSSFQQRNCASSTAAPTTIKQAFRQKKWHYARIDGSSSKVRAAEIRVAIGSSLIAEDYFQFAYHSLFIAPTGNKQTNHQIFEAVVGDNQHFAFGGAIFFQIPLNYDTSSYGLCFFTNLESIFLIRNTQLRTFDLKDKPWSRYLLYNEKGEGGKSNIPGVNILTHKVLVRPYGVFDFSCGWRYITNTIEAEIGYNVWGRSNERIELKRPFNHPCEFLGTFGIAGSAPGKTASRSTIAQQAPDDIIEGNDIFQPIKILDLDPASAESGSVLNHKVHFTIGTSREYLNSKVFGGGGIYIDIPQKNTSLRVWGAWITGGATF